MKLCRLTLVLAALWGAQQRPAEAAPPPRHRTLSASRQFVVYGGDPLLAARICARAESLKRGLLKLLGAADQWRDPILVVLEERAAETAPSLAPVTLQTMVFEGQLRYQIRCAPPANEETMAAVLVEALCREYANRGLSRRLPLPKQTAVLPLWLISGVAEMIAEHNEVLLPVLQRAIEEGHALGLTELLETSSLSAQEQQQLFRAHSWLLVESLLLLPKGTARFRQLLVEAAPETPAVELFGTLYGAEVGEGVGREKWWGLQLARKSLMQLAQALTAEETARQLKQVLELELRDPQTGKVTAVGFAQLGSYIEQPWFGAVCTDKARALLMLRGRFHPFYREAAVSYLEALDWLSKGALGRYRAAAKRAAQQQVRADQQAGAFREYLDRVEHPAEPSPKLIREYLDGFERQTEKTKGE